MKRYTRHSDDDGPKRVREPVQVYLDPADRERLERLAARFDATKSDVLRRGLEALEALSGKSEPPHGASEPLPTFAGGRGLHQGIDLDATAALLDIMDGPDAAG